MLTQRATMGSAPSPKGVEKIAQPF